MKTTFKVFVTKDISEHPTFEEAFAAFKKALIEMIHQGMSWQALETFCWIEGIFESEYTGVTSRFPLYFYAARDFAHEVGLLVELPDGQAIIADPLPSVPLEKVIDVYTEAGLQELVAIVNMEFQRALAMRQPAIE